LLKPIANENDKMKIILQAQKVDDALVRATPDGLDAYLKEIDVMSAAELAKVT